MACCWQPSVNPSGDGGNVRKGLSRLNHQRADLKCCGFQSILNKASNGWLMAHNDTNPGVKSSVGKNLESLQ